MVYWMYILFQRVSEGSSHGALQWQEVCNACLVDGMDGGHEWRVRRPYGSCAFHVVSTRWTELLLLLILGVKHKAEA